MTPLSDLDRPALENHARILFLAAERTEDAAACVRLDRELWETGLRLELARREEVAMGGSYGPREEEAQKALMARSLTALCPLAAREESLT